MLGTLLIIGFSAAGFASAFASKEVIYSVGGCFLYFTGVWQIGEWVLL